MVYLVWSNSGLWAVCEERTVAEAWVKDYQAVYGGIFTIEEWGIVQG